MRRAGALAPILLLFASGCCLLQRAALFPAPDPIAPQGAGQWIQEVHAWYAPGPPEAPVVAFFHGNGDQVGHVVELGALLNQAGLGFYAIEYPGYGGVPGRPSEKSVVAAADAALRYLASDLHVPRERLVLMGQSLGTAVATDLAARGWGSRMILLSPFTSVEEEGRHLVPWAPVRLFLCDRFDTEAKAKTIRFPVLIAHGTEDHVVPTEMGARLAQAFPAATLELVPGAHHNDIFKVLRKTGRFERLTRFALSGS